jgi:protein-disulfide isomerase
VSGFALGRPDAPLTIVEFTDLQCPFCQRYHRTTFEEVVRQYVDTGKARYVSVDFPLTTIHPFAQRAARAARCAGEQEYFWEMRHEILINNAQLSDATFDAAARALKLDEAAFKACLADTTRFDEELRRDAALAATARVSGTPSFVIGRMSGRGLEGKLLVGAQPFDAFRIALEELLAGK